MKVIMSGASGFIGTHLTQALTNKGWEVVGLSIDDFKLEEAEFAQKFEGADWVINLAGAPINRRWSPSYKKELYASRIETTKKIVKAMASLAKKPRLFVSTSAVGIYDGHGTYDEENAVYAKDFLGRLAQDWESEALIASNFKIRTIIFRFGLVLGKDGGPLKQMLTPFRLGLGGVIGSGQQYFSWVHIDDLVRAYFFAWEHEMMSGIFNLTAPNPTTNYNLTKTLGHILKRPTCFFIPFFALRIVFGEGAEAIASGQSVIPKRMIQAGFEFRFKTIDQALKNLVSS